MSRPTDWSPLGLSADPVPGEPALVLTGGRSYLDVADAISSAERKLRSIDVGDYISKAVDELAKKAEKVADDIGKAHDRYRETGLALVEYSPKLDTAQQDSLAALAAAKLAKGDADAADDDTKRYLRLSDEATDPAQKLHYKNLADDDQPSRAASAKLERARDDLSDAISNRDNAADAAADRIKDIVDSDGLNDSWWDNWGVKVLKVITDVAGWVATIAGVLALLVCWIPVIGQLLAGALLIITAVAAVINALGNVVLAATGEQSWTTAIISVVGAVLACVGLGGATRIVLSESGRFAESFAAASKVNSIASRQALAPGEQMEAITRWQSLKITPSEWRESLSAYDTALPTPKPGDTVYRTFAKGGNKYGGSWTPNNPADLKYPSSTMGLPKESTTDWVVNATIQDPSKVGIVRHALPYAGRPGGAAEFKYLDRGGATTKGLIENSTTPFAVR